MQNHIYFTICGEFACFYKNIVLTLSKITI